MLLLRQTLERQVSDIRTLVGLEEVDLADHEALGLSVLHYAAWYNHEQAVRTLIEWKHDVMARDNEGATPLHYVARYKNRVFQVDASGAEKKPTSPKAVIQLLLQAGADLNARDSMGVTPLVNATLRGNTEAVEELLNQDGIDIKSSDNRGVTSLLVAAKYGRAELARRLVTAGCPVTAADDLGETAMHIAAEENHVGVMQVLLDAAEDKGSEVVNALTKKNEAPIDLAIENRNHDAVQLLLEHGAVIRKTSRDGHHTPAHFAAAAGAPRILALLLDKDPVLIRMRSMDQSTPLHRAAQFDRPNVAKLLLGRGADVESRDHLNCTPLHVAAAHGSDRALAVLLESGATLDALNNKDRSVLHIAADNHRPRTLKVLLEHLRGAGMLERLISCDDRLGNSPLHLAAQGGFPKITKILLENGGDIRNKNESEETPLHVAARSGRTTVVSLLLEATDEMNEDATLSVLHDEDENGNTPLHLAATGGHKHVLDLLQGANAQHDTINRRLWTPAFCAAAGGHVDALRALLKAGAEINITDGNKNNPLHVAAAAGHDGVVQVLVEHGCSASARNGQGLNPLDIAIHHGHRDVTEAIINSDQWKEALRSRSRLGSHQVETTPLRQLIRKMPEVAETVLDKCIKYPDDFAGINDPDLKIEFEFEFLDDTFSCTGWGDTADISTTIDNTYTSDGALSSKAQAYTQDTSMSVHNHVLSVMVKSRRCELLYHPLCLALMRSKWRLAQVFFFIFLFYYVAFVALLTSYFVWSPPPYLLNETMLQWEEWPACRAALISVAQDSDMIVAPQRLPIGSILIWTLACIGIAIEVVQMCFTRQGYFHDATNFLDWSTYILAGIVVLPIHPCAIRTDWQWELGAVCIFLSWLNLILFLRRLPTLGLYIVMVGEVSITFLKFFVFCFSLFIFAFGFTFFMLFRNQAQFETPLYAFAKVFVMMVGELDYVDMFHPEDKAESVHYEAVSYILYIVFLGCVTIVIMNLLTGLAVGDVQVVQEQAELKKMALQVELALDVEYSLPKSWRRKLKCAASRVTLYPNRSQGYWMHHLTQFLDGPMSARSIAKAIYREYEELQEEERGRRNEKDSGMSSGRFQQVVAMAHSNRERLTAVDNKLERLEKMLQALLTHHDVTWQEEDGDKKKSKDGDKKKSKSKK